MSVRDSERTLALALASLQAQTLRDWELLIADDGSTDASAAILADAARRDQRIHILGDRSPRGLAARLNQLVDAARAPLIARMDADDVSYPLRLKRQVAFLETHPEVDLVGTSMVVFDDSGRGLRQRVAPAEHAEICRRPARGFPLFHPTWTGRASWFRAHPYAPAARYSADQDLLFRTYAASCFANISEPLFGYREGHLVLRKLLEGRRSMAARFAHRLWRTGHPLLAGATVTEQALKVAADVLAISLGLERVLARRSTPLPDAEATAWLRVWEAANARVAAENRSDHVGERAR
jgi:glycosyltransferase involved in cell wall biosynthesis